MEYEIEVNKRPSIFKEFDSLNGEGRFCEVTEWANGEGVDVSFSDQQFNLSWDEWRILKELMNVFETQYNVAQSELKKLVE